MLVLSVCLYGLLALCFCVRGHPGLAGVSDRPIADLGYANYEGTRLAANVDQYLGMRYAQPPIGDLRFRAARDPVRELGLQNATEFQPICLGAGQQPSRSIGEDCLFVNVFKPSQATSKSKLPVWVYIQGGGYKTNSDYNFNGTGVVQASNHSIVFVNFNYRVGALGFLGGRQVSRDGDLNVGLLDQRQLLFWVKKHISKFGGDPDHVVIQGTSAGAGSISHHLTAYGARDDKLFVGVGFESAFWPRTLSMSDTDYQFEWFLNGTGCSAAKNPMVCLRSASVDSIAAASKSRPFPEVSADALSPSWYWLPVIDGEMIQDSLYKQFGRGRFIKVPALIGNTDDEGDIFANNATNVSDFSNFLKSNYPTLSKAQIGSIANAYPPTTVVPSHGTWYPSVSRAYGDATFVCPSQHQAISISRYLSPQTVWNYRFNEQFPILQSMGWGTVHASDEPAIFGPRSGSIFDAMYKDKSSIVTMVQGYYISFVRTLNPNPYKSGIAPYWQPWGLEGGKRMRLETDSTVMETIPKEQTQLCNMWKDLADSTGQ